ncbi:MAG: FliH/SctL family protein [Nitrospiraceae bacterium]|nr:FliH/SctL family protein [Nitrospiraceae bacterium]
MWSDDFISACPSRDVLPFEMPQLDAGQSRGDQSRGDPLPDFTVGSPKGAGVAVSNRLETLEREAYEKGFAAGEKAGLAMGEQKTLVLIGKLETLIREIASFKERTVREMEPQFVELAMSAARQIVIEELTVNPEAVTRIVREALSKMQPGGKITIRTSPSVLETISRHKPELLGGHADIVFENDPGAQRFGCVIAGDAQEISTGIDSQLKNLIQQMTGTLGDRQ